MSTEDYEIGQRVEVAIDGHFMNGMRGTVVDRDRYTVDVRFDTVTSEMMGYGDTKTGVASFEPNQIIKA